MKQLKKINTYILICIILFSLMSCKQANQLKESLSKGKNTEIQINNGAAETEISNSASKKADIPSNMETVFWEEITSDGVNEKLLIKNINKGNLEYVAKILQELTKLIEDKGDKDKKYWLTTNWHSDVIDSKQYKKVISMGTEAMKPLYLIIYKSHDHGLYALWCWMIYPVTIFQKKQVEMVGMARKKFLELLNKKILDNKFQ